MSEQDKRELAELMQRGRAFDKKWNVYKIITVIVTVLGSTMYLGSQVGDWREWRRHTDSDLTEIKQWKQNTQTAANNQRAAYNRSIKIKP